MSNEKEFVSVYVSEVLSDNYARILKDTTLATQVDYHKRFVGWGLKTPNDIERFITRMESKWLAGEYKYPTVRQYKAVLGYALSNAYQFKINPNKLNYKYREYYTIANLASLDELEDLYSKVVLIGRDDDVAELDRLASYNARTSSTKDKRFPQPLLDRILSMKAQGKKNSASELSLLQDFLLINTKIGLRPVEYQNATLIRHDIAHNPHILSKLSFSHIVGANKLGLVVKAQDDTKPLLLIKNAKNSHSRACGEYRLLYLDVLKNSEIDILRKMMITMRDINEGSDKSFAMSVIKPMARKLYYILTSDEQCKTIIKRLHDEKLRSYRKQSKTQKRYLPTYKRPTLYSTRHQAVANAKSAKLHPVLIAACFGHSSVHTAEAHYGKSVFGRGGGIMPAQASVNEVVANLTSAQLLVENKSMKDRVLVSDKKPIKAPTPTYIPRL